MYTIEPVFPIVRRKSGHLSYGRPRFAVFAWDGPSTTARVSRDFALKADAEHEKHLIEQCDYEDANPRSTIGF
jgi:hypothetical protein